MSPCPCTWYALRTKPEQSPAQTRISTGKDKTDRAMHQIVNNWSTKQNRSFVGNFLRRFADEKIVLLLGLIRPSLIGGMPSDGVLVASSTVRWMPLEPSNGLFRGRPKPSASVRPISADPIIRGGNLFQFGLEIIKLVGRFNAGEVGARNGAAKALRQIKALADFDDEVPIRLRLAIHAVLDRAAEELI